MNIEIQRSSERGLTKIGWLNSRHSFSFGNYHNPKKMNFGLLRVLNDDIIGAGKGFGMHFHDNMEIVSIAVEGALEHKDSMGSHGIIKENEIQSMSAGTGIKHSEFNHSKKEKAHFLQIWIEPKEQDIKPEYCQKKFSDEDFNNRLRLVVSGKKEKNTLCIHQDAYFLIGDFNKGKSDLYKLEKVSNGVYFFVIEGSVNLENEALGTGDAAEITQTEKISFKATEKSKILVIEVPMK
ncbi:MAG TPA: pirin family protein [Candidatus Nanoarchaeia archaeon]|nr:pirin family protein [Candidatus Nanoarchaeia archaeon]